MTLARGSVLMSSSDRILYRRKSIDHRRSGNRHAHPPVADSAGASRSKGTSADLFLTPIRETKALLVIVTWRIFPSAGCLSNFDTADCAAEVLSNLI